MRQASSPLSATLLLLTPMLALLMAPGCSFYRSVPQGANAMTYAHQVPPGVTFDMRAGIELDDDMLMERLRNVRVLFLGEHHMDVRSHRFQARMLEALAKAGRKVTVTLEMYPDAANPALEKWRSGKLEELEFLEESDWYSHWSFPFGMYREVFQVIRRYKMPVYGVNADEDTRKAVRNNELKELDDALLEEIGDMEGPLEPQKRYLMDVLTNSGHSNSLKYSSPRFLRYHRVQRLWDQIMGRRTARLAQEQPPEGITVLLIGSGHLAYGLGANLHAARETALPQLTIWDTVLSGEDRLENGLYWVTVGSADMVRVYEYQDGPERPEFPSLMGLKLESEEGKDGIKVARIGMLAGRELAELKKDDVILALNGTPVKTVTALRFAYESLPFGKEAELKVLRAEQELTIKVTPRHSRD